MAGRRLQGARETGRSEQLCGLEQRQSHDSGVAAAQLRDENGGTALYGVGTRLVERFPSIPVSAGFGGLYGPKSDHTATDPAVEPGGGAQRYRGQNLMAAAG